MDAYDKRQIEQNNLETAALGFVAFAALNTPFALGLLRLGNPEDLTPLTQAFLYGSAILPPVITGALALKAHFNLRRLNHQDAFDRPTVLPAGP